MNSETLIGLLETAYAGRDIPKPVADELRGGHEHPENQCLYEQLDGVTWREVTAEMIEATYPVFFLLTDSLFAYYLPAVLKHIITCGDLGTVEQLVRRIMPRWKQVSEFDPQHVCTVYNLDGVRVRLLRDVLQWALNNIVEMECRDVSRIETVVNALSRP